MVDNAILIHGGTVLTMDPDIGDRRADVLVEDGVVSRIAPDLTHVDAKKIDATGQLVLPGLIDTHRHTWQSVIRGIAADWTLADYYYGIRLAISPAFTAEDLRLANRIGALDALNSGVTTLLDFSHCNNTPEHSDAAVLGLMDAGIRAVFGYGFFESSPMGSRFGTHHDRIADFHRIADRYFSDPSSRLQLGVSLSEIFALPWEQTLAEISAARERGALIVNHTACVWGSQLTMGIAELAERGLLGPDMVHVHCNTLSETEWQLVAASGGKVSISVETELNMGMGRPVFGACRAHGISPTLSADVISLNSGDLWHEMRFGLGFARWDSTHEQNLAGEMPAAVTTSAREALQWSTVNAADALGQAGRIGVLREGAHADIITVGGPAFEQHPLIDPFGTLIFQTTAADVQTVLVGGDLKKLRGELVGEDRAALAREADRAAEAILQRVHDTGYRLPGTPDDAWAAFEPLVAGFRAGAGQPVAGASG
jgi:cytosine/adenosine deaminase-related metal-dependent hydrolase